MPGCSLPVLSRDLTGGVNLPNLLTWVRLDPNYENNIGSIKDSFTETYTVCLRLLFAMYSMEGTMYSYSVYVCKLVIYVTVL